jgi:hypothetical protein
LNLGRKGLLLAWAFTAAPCFECTTGTIKNATVSWQKASVGVKAIKAMRHRIENLWKSAARMVEFFSAKLGFPQGIKPKLPRQHNYLKVSGNPKCQNRNFEPSSPKSSISERLSLWSAR